MENIKKAVEIIKKKVKNNPASVGDAVISEIYYEDFWDKFSIANDALNLINSPLIHLGSVNYNSFKLVNDSFDKNKSRDYVGADFFNLLCASLIFVADFSTKGSIKKSLFYFGNASGMIGNLINWADKQPINDPNVYIVLNLPDCQQFTISVPRDELIELGIMDKDGHYINGGISGIYNLGDSINGSDGASSSDVNDGNPGSDDNPGDGYNPKFPKDGTPLNKIPPAGDPVVLNLSSEAQSNVLDASYSYFDYDGDGFAERTAWIGEQQGLLVVDLNENGIIDDGKELFGDKTILKNGRKAKDGYQALNDVDENKDGVIDSQDSAWIKLRVWIDNGDGMTQEGELKTLEELGIETMKLNEERTGTNEEEGNSLEKIGFFTKADGTTGELSDYTFEVNRIDAYNKNQVEVSAEVAEEIYLPESGMLENSWQVMMKSENDELKNLLHQYQDVVSEKEKNSNIGSDIIHNGRKYEQRKIYGRSTTERNREILWCRVRQRKKSNKMDSPVVG